MVTKLRPSINPQVIATEELLWKWCRFGWAYRGIGARAKAEQDWYAERVRYEMGLILDKGLSDFFLFTSDTIRWAKNNGIPIGPGRGSTAASVVAWLLRITEIDPYRHQGMIFERFLDVTRNDPPDIDVDCSDERRHEVWAYLADKYGSDCVGHIGNFTRYRGKNSLADIARVYSIPIDAKETVANLLIERSGGDSRFDATLEDTFEAFPAAQAVARQFPDLLKATRLEGNYRGMSVHACGLVIANSPLTDICAVYERNGERILSIDKYDAEYIDALKLDFLGLSTMGMIARCIEMAGITLEDLYDIPDDDPDALAVFKRGDVTGVFQFEGRATRLVNRDVSPDNFGHVTDINALSRPGPLFSGQTAEYVEVRHGRNKARHLHQLVSEITQDTYGQIIYQEQILRILKEIGGFDWTDLNWIRKVISKKIGQASFEKSYTNFADGAQKLHGISPELSKQIWDRLVTAGTYAFNVAHAVSYSMIAFWTAWLKAHYRLEFYAASLAKAAGDAEQQFRLMKDALAHSIDIKPPSLEHSRMTWRPVPGIGLVAGWRQIPGIGEKMAKRIDAGSVKYHSWYEMDSVPGIGPLKIQRMMAFAQAKDPFGLYRTEKKLKSVRAWLARNIRDINIPRPTHDGHLLAAMKVKKQEFTPGKRQRWNPGPEITYIGIVRRVEYKDIAEDERSRTGKEMEDILRDLYRPDLLKRATLHCYDTSDEEVYARVNRFQFPKLRRTLETIRINHDVVVVEGNRIAGFGTPVMINKIWVIDPD